MRIGELAALAGVSTRAVRHYHHLGLLPEPARLTNGYRIYGLRDAVELARIRRLCELGLSLEEVRDVLADDQGRDLREVLAELDADLARQEREIHLRRTRLAALLAQERLHPDDPVSEDMAALFGKIPAAPAGLMAKEREWLALLDTTATETDRRQILDLLGPMADDPAFVARVQEVYGRIDELDDPADPRVPELARALVGLVPPGVPGTDLAAADLTDGSFARVVLADLSPAQEAVARHALKLLVERTPG
ncbi:MerR family transcriptional regulator [Nonomuraea sp. NPDC046570]|uniref:MerR family transcriptional regulator n=1 Tax=Nonomuraea sp. NPDC046570 TaxID=3155255 RepID=UPI0033C23990